MAEYAERGDPPLAEWPGTIRMRQDVMAACGDKRGLVSGSATGMKPTLGIGMNGLMPAHVDGICRWGSPGIRSSSSGEYGAGKTTLGIKAALADFRRGHCVFSNAACLIGWRLDYEEMYTALGLMPKHSSLLIDESSAALSSKMGGGVAVSSFAEMNLNSRKQKRQGPTT